eukprot:scaffold6007_cov183-Amphora_coffeaeformis.AAC.1
MQLEIAVVQKKDDYCGDGGNANVAIVFLADPWLEIINATLFPTTWALTIVRDSRRTVPSAGGPASGKTALPSSSNFHGMFVFKVRIFFPVKRSN